MPSYMWYSIFPAQGRKCSARASVQVANNRAHSLSLGERTCKWSWIAIVKAPWEYSKKNNCNDEDYERDQRLPFLTKESREEEEGEEQPAEQAADVGGGAREFELN